MARSKNNRSASVPGKVGKDDLDDIDLLNIYRYPDHFSPTLLAKVRNSRDYQKRLEVLLKEAAVNKRAPTAPERSTGRSSVESVPSAEGAGAAKPGQAGPRKAREPSIVKVKKFIKKYLL